MSGLVLSLAFSVGWWGDANPYLLPSMIEVSVLDKASGHVERYGLVHGFFPDGDLYRGSVLSLAFVPDHAGPGVDRWLLTSSAFGQSSVPVGGPDDVAHWRVEDSDYVIWASGFEFDPWRLDFAAQLILAGFGAAMIVDLCFLPVRLLLRAPQAVGLVDEVD